MKEKYVKVLEDREQLLIDTMQDLGLKRQEAALIVFMNGAGKLYSKDIERGTQLRQPEVSRAMKILRENDWVEVQDIKGAGKGRPKKIYRLKASLYEVIGHLEQRKLRESAMSMGSIQRLKELAAS
ncbi:MAG: ArsR family transcriptional regulator [Methanotrichaceae archaeon]|nr:ArsR family transcriptional regulator [Methanotrichaceae archaeon]